MKGIVYWTRKMEEAAYDYQRTGMFECPMSNACADVERECADCFILEAVDILTMLKKRLKEGVKRVLDDINERECCHEKHKTE